MISVANRDQTKLASYTGTYTLSKAIVSGSGIATIGFYSQADAGGTVVGTASGTVNADTTVELGTVVVTGTVASVAVADTTVALGSGTTQLLFSAKDASGNLVAVTPGSAVWSLTSGSDKLSLSADGIVTPGATGTAKLHATVDGIASPDATITVTPAAPAVGTVRLQNGPILEVVGTCAQAIQGSTNTLQTFKITKSDGTTETVSNTLVADDMGVNDPVICCAQGTQPLQATFSDSNHLFYDLSNYTYKVPITAGGVFTVNVAMKTTDNISTESACTVGGLQVDSFTLQSPYSGLAPRIMIPLAYVLDVPLAGQPLNHLSGSVQYDSIYALRRFDVYVNYSSSNDYSNSQSLDAAGALSFSNASGSSNLAQGGVRVTLNME